MTIEEAIKRLVAGDQLTVSELYEVLRQIEDGTVSDVQIKALDAVLEFRSSTGTFQRFNVN